MSDHTLCCQTQDIGITINTDSSNITADRIEDFHYKVSYCGPRDVFELRSRDNRSELGDFTIEGYVSLIFKDKEAVRSILTVDNSVSLSCAVDVRIIYDISILNIKHKKIIEKWEDLIFREGSFEKLNTGEFILELEGSIRSIHRQYVD